jgi:hypothetical protein
MIDIGTRKHGPFDSRYPRPGARADSPPVASEECELDTWEGEGGQVDPHPRRVGRGNGLRRSKPAALPAGLSWEGFCALAYPGMKRHYLPAIAAWCRYRDSDSSRPRTTAPAAAGRGTPRSRAVLSG